MNKNIITGRFDKKENFGFLVPENKQEHKTDFFIALRNSKNANDGDIVEAIEIKNSKGKSKEAKIINITKKNTVGTNPRVRPADITNLENSSKKQKKSIIKQDPNNIIGIFSQGKGDFGFIDVEGVEKGYFVFSHNKNSALDGDKVEASVKVFKGKPEATVIRVVERKLDLIVGEYRPGKDNKFGFVVPNNPQVKTDIFVPGKFCMEAQTGDIVGVHVTDWKGKNPEGVIREIIGKKGDKKIDVLGLIIEGGGKLRFPEEVINYANDIKNIVASYLPLGEIERGLLLKNEVKRTDLTNLFTFTIDGEDAKDLDDAISIKKLEIGGYKLFVHIADVAEYVKEKSILDKEAYKRATSTYLVDRVIPMLPEKLSNDLCSLNPHTEKLTLTCEMTIGNNGKITSQKVYESVISSDFRLTYKEVDEIVASIDIPHPNPLPKGEGIEQSLKDNVASSLPLGETEGGLLITPKLTQTIKIANELKQKITKYRTSTGVLNFDFPETKILLDDEGNPVSIKEYPRFDSNKLIEEFMVSANEAVSREFSDLPFLYRIHEEPKEDDLIKLQDTLNLFGIKFVFKKGNTKEFSELLKLINSPSTGGEGARGGGSRIFLEKAVLRTLSKAIYSKENEGHFGLGLSFYSHFTSPIRRYPDLQIHRIIKEKIHKKLNKSRITHYEYHLEEVSKHTSTKERKAEKLEYKVRDYYTVQYYKDKVGDEFDGVISGVLSKGFFVALKDTSEGFVELTNSEFIESLQEHIDLSSGKKYRLGDEIKVRLIETDEIMLRLNFEVV